MAIKIIRTGKWLFMLLLLTGLVNIYEANGKTRPRKSKKTVKKSVPVAVDPVKLPQNVFISLIDSADYFVVNHSADSRHIDLPRKTFNMFTGFIRDSSATEVTGLKSLIYYNYTLKDGRVLIGDVFWNDTASYIVFRIYDKKYVNYFSREGVRQLTELFKL